MKPVRSRLLPAVARPLRGALDWRERARRARDQLLTLDMDRWEGLRCEADPELSLDAWELNDFAPRRGWPGVLFLHAQGSSEAGRRHAPWLARGGLLCATVSHQGIGPQTLTLARRELLSLQVDESSTALWLSGLRLDELGPLLAELTQFTALVLDLQPSPESELLPGEVTKEVSTPSPLPPLCLLSPRQPAPLLQSSSELLSPSARSVRGRARAARRWLIAQLAKPDRRSKWRAHKKKAEK